MKIEILIRLAHINGSEKIKKYIKYIKEWANCMTLSKKVYVDSVSFEEALRKSLEKEI